MKKLYETILGILSSLIIFSSQAESKKITNVSNDYHVPDIPKISSLDQIELISKPSPLILKQADFDTDNIFAGHRSHSSHASHRSHASHSSGSTSPSKTPLEEKKTTSEEPRSPSETTTAPLEPTKSQKPLPDSTPSTTPPPSSSIKKEWRTTTEWLSQPCKLYQREVFGILNTGGGFKGLVTECKDDSIEITDKTKEWIRLKDIKSLMWK
ncbi:MAG: hypothetical protein Q8N98_00885 [bacterium]|nr:hypothetical protein [bacterium]